MQTRPIAIRVLALSLALGACLSISLSRDAWQRPEQVVEALDLEPGDHVADLGAGGGYFTFRLAGAVGPEGRVYAVDVDTDLTESLAEEAREQGQSNVEVILAPYDDPKLPEGGVDLIFTCNTYHHIDDRPAYFARAARYLRPGGVVVIVDMLPKAWLQRLTGHVSPAEMIRSEMREAGYVLEREYTFLPEQSFFVFTRAEP